MTRKEMINMFMEVGFPYIIASAFVEMQMRYGYTDPYVGRPKSEELSDDMAALGHVPIKEVSFRGKHPDLDECIFTLQKYEHRGKISFCMYIFGENGDILDERGPIPERDVVSDI